MRHLLLLKPLYHPSLFLPRLRLLSILCILNTNLQDVAVLPQRQRHGIQPRSMAVVLSDDLLPSRRVGLPGKEQHARALHGIGWHKFY